MQTLLIAERSESLATGCECLGPCFDGPNAVLYPDGEWLDGLTAGDAPRIVEKMKVTEPNS